MNTEGISKYLIHALRSVGFSIYLPSGSGFANSLSKGDTVSGHVVQRYGNGRYLVNFSGQEKVVESENSLRVGEDIQGRVVSIGEKIEIRQLAKPGDSHAESNAANNNSEHNPFYFGKNELLVQKLFNAYRAKISKSESAILTTQMQASRSPESMALAGLVLAKLGLPQDQGLLKILCRTITADKRGEQPFSATASGVDLETVPNHANAESDTNSDAFAALLQTLINLPSDTNQKTEHADLIKSAESFRQSSEPENRDLSRRVFNTQIGGAVSHRITSLPIWINGDLVEVNIALFDQHKNPSGGYRLRHRQVVLSLKTENLGRVNIKAKFAERSLQLDISSDFSRGVDMLAEHMDALRQALSSQDWCVEQIRYKTETGKPTSGPVHTVVDHIVSQDSLSRLM